MRPVVMPISACVLVTFTVAPAFARDYSHRHHHVATAKHFHHHSWRVHSRHSHRWRSHRRWAVLPQPAAQPFALPFAWQPQPIAPPFAAARQKPITRPLPTAVAWQPASPAMPLAPVAPFAPAIAVGPAQRAAVPSQFGSLVATHAQANGLPEALVHRVIMRESRYNPRAVSRGNYGLMQIRLGTARAMGYTGSAAGLLDANTNMAYAVRYLAGAYRAAGGNHNRAVAYYARGYYYQAKRMGFSAYARTTPAVAPRTLTAPFVAANPFRVEVF